MNLLAPTSNGRQTHLLVLWYYILATQSHAFKLRRCNPTEWVQSTYPSCGWINPDLDSYTSTYSFRTPKRHIYDYPIMVFRLMQPKLLPVTVIRYDLTVKGFGYYVFLVVTMLNFVTGSYCNIYNGCMSITSFIQWHDPTVNSHKCPWSGKLDHRLTNGLVD
jgi:hypothetical protein